MNKKIFYCLLITSCYLLLAAYGYSAFQDTGWGARPGGMGNTFTAIANDASAPLWNPAGIAQLKNIETTFMYNKLFVGIEDANITQMFGALIYPTKRGAFGFTITDFSLWGYYKENTFSGSYAYNLSDGLNIGLPIMIGLNLKYLTHSYNLDSRTKSMNDPVFAQTSSGGFTPDVGILVKPYRLSIGVSALNILQPDVGLKTSDKVPMVIKSGMAYRLGGWGIIDSLTPTVDISSRKPEGGTSDTKVSFGMELWIRKTLALRIGGNDREVTAGCSYSKAFSESDIQFDYAFLSPTELTEASGSHRISISFGMSVPERKKLDSTRAAIIPVKETEVTVETIKEKYLKRGYQHFERAEYSDAISAWEEVLKVDPGNSEVKNKIKMAKMWLGQETSSGADSEQIAGTEFAREQLNINTANEIELIDVGFTREEARNIIAYRKKSKFKKIDDLSLVPGMTSDKFNKMKLKLKIR